MSVEWVDVEDPPAPEPASRGRRRLWQLLVVGLTAAVAAVAVLAVVGRRAVVSGHGTGVQPLGVLINPDDPSTGSIVPEHEFGMTADHDSHEVAYVIGLRNTHTVPVHIARIVLHVATADRPNVLGVRIIASSTATDLTPPPAIDVIPAGDSAGLWVEVRYACAAHSVLVIPHPTVTITTDPHDSLTIGPDDGLVGPNDPISFACDPTVH